MAHGDVYIVLNIITWSLILFILLYLFIILVVLPILYKQLRIKIYVYNIFNELLFLNFLELFNLNIILFIYLDNILKCSNNVLQKNNFLSNKLNY